MVNNVFFEPAARTHWHTHEAGPGAAGARAARAGCSRATAPARGCRPATRCTSRAGEEHWHGAAPESYLLHLAVSVGATDWLDAVSDEDYASAIGAA